MSLKLTVNGESLTSASDPMKPLVDVLRDEFHLTGAKPVCREGFCGACMVLIDGTPVTSCLVPVGLAAGRDIVTAEGLAPHGKLSPIQQGLDSSDAVQCGMCFPGMVVTLTHALASHRCTTRDDVRAALTGNICRCTGYERIIETALSVAAASAQGGDCV